MQGFETEEIIRNHKLRTSMFFVRPREMNSNAQLLWEVSLWERIFPRANPERSDATDGRKEVGRERNDTEDRGNPSSEAARNRPSLEAPSPNPQGGSTGEEARSRTPSPPLGSIPEEATLGWRSTTAGPENQEEEAARHRPPPIRILDDAEIQELGGGGRLSPQMLILDGSEADPGGNGGQKASGSSGSDGIAPEAIMDSEGQQETKRTRRPRKKRKKPRLEKAGGAPARFLEPCFGCLFSVGWRREGGVFLSGFLA